MQHELSIGWLTSPGYNRRQRSFLSQCDPEHDTPETLKPFIGRYSADFQVLTGDDQQIRNIAHQLGIKYQRDEKKEGGYSIVHSSSIALINHQSELQGLFTGRVDASSIT
ncbi:SCO family protein [Candidatus Vondammii sp. HM_W22]|uniref:SCO family protein n=1 Tax=Candidatus Vondammii sp. HM_W22 TaxID=2687299 RepID=UPI0024026FB6|nr:SCO family protein [Candidatus Vondammii sp. HM_W22]